MSSGLFAAISSAADGASKMANQAKLSAEVSTLRQRVIHLKRRWGEDCFDAYFAGEEIRGIETRTGCVQGTSRRSMPVTRRSSDRSMKRW